MLIDLNTILLFFSSSLLLALAPGPDNIYVLTQSMLKTSSYGIIITLGLCTGLLVHTALVAFGLAVVFKTSVIAFNIFKFAGAAYLLFLAWKSFRAGESRFDLAKSTEKNTYRYYYFRGIIMNVTNPKVSVFFLAFLPQFANPEKGHLTIQLISLGFMFIVSAFSVFSLISLLVGKIGDWFIKSKYAEKILNWISGIIFIGLAVKLALTMQ